MWQDLLYIIWFIKQQQLVSSQTDTTNIEEETWLLWELAGNNDLCREIKSIKCKNHGNIPVLN